MQPTVRFLLVIAAAGLIAAGCGSEAATPAPSIAQPSPSASGAAATPASSATPTPSLIPSPTPSATSAPSPTVDEAPSPSPTAAAPATADTYRGGGEIVQVEFAPDGRIVVAERDWETETASVVVLDDLGHVLEGWPWEPSGDERTMTTIALGPRGSVYAATRSESGQPRRYSWRLHRLDRNGTEVPGFPVAIAGGAFCELTAGPDDAAWLACEEEDDVTGAIAGSVRPVRADGSTPSGWPVSFRASPQVVGFRPDGAVVVALAMDGGSRRVTVLGATGKALAGWPRRVPEGGEISVDARGRVHVTATAYQAGECGRPVETSWTVLRADGSTASGWPKRYPGWASAPLFQGTVATILTGSGRAYRYDARGRVADGWPVGNIPQRVACSSGNKPVPAGHGAVAAVAGRSATVIQSDGSTAAGWPVRLPYTAATLCPDCAPGPNEALAPAVGDRGMWIAAYRAGRPQIIGISRDGGLPGAWQRAVGHKRDIVMWIRLAPGGRVWALLGRWSNELQSEQGLLVPVGEDVPAG